MNGTTPANLFPIRSQTFWLQGCLQLYTLEIFQGCDERWGYFTYVISLMSKGPDSRYRHLFCTWIILLLRLGVFLSLYLLSVFVFHLKRIKILPWDNTAPWVCWILIRKLLQRRLSSYIGALVHPDSSGFILERDGHVLISYRFWNYFFGHSDLIRRSGDTCWLLSKVFFRHKLCFS